MLNNSQNNNATTQQNQQHHHNINTTTTTTTTTPSTTTTTTRSRRCHCCGTWRTAGSCRQARQATQSEAVEASPFLRAAQQLWETDPAYHSESATVGDRPGRTWWKRQLLSSVVSCEVGIVFCLFCIWHQLPLTLSDVGLPINPSANLGSNSGQKQA